MARSRRSFEKLPLDSIKRDTPIRLDVAAHLAFPCGGVTAANLRLEASRGRLVISKVAGKHFTTLQAIDEMFRLCRVHYGGAETKKVEPGPDLQAAKAAAEMRVKKLRERPA